MSEQPEQLTVDTLARLADELAVTAKNGLFWTKDRYDRERFARVLQIATELLAHRVPDDRAAITRWYTDEPGTITPKVGASIAAFDDAGRLLLIQRKDNAKWALPGGIVEYGETLAAAAREAWEESGMRVRATALLGIFDARRHGFNTVADWKHVVFLAQIISGAPGPSDETLAAAFFAEDEATTLPFSPGQEITIRHAFAARTTPHIVPFFDP